MKLDDNVLYRQIDIGGGVMVNVSQEDYGKKIVFCEALEKYECVCW